MHNPEKFHRLSDILQVRAKATPAHIAVEDEAGHLNYDELYSRARALASDIKHRGVQRGDRVFLLIGNSREFAIAFWAVQLIGGVAVTLPVETSTERLEWMIRDSEPRLILSEADISSADVEVLTVLADAHIAKQSFQPSASVVSSDDLALMIYTSGSTGKPKGVMLSQKNVITAACSVATYLDYRDTDRIFCAIPFTFDYGLHQLTMAALSGACVVAERDFSKPFLSVNRLSRSGATVLPLVPTIGALLCQIGGRFDLSQIRLISNTAAALSTALIDDLCNLMPQARLFSMYGLTECHRCTYLDPDQLDSRKTSVGKAIPYTRMWVVDDEGRRRERNAAGELVIAGDTIMRGYWQRPDATEQRLRILPETGEITFYTGDICRLDDEGYCYFIGRADDILKVRGEKVAPVEVERCLTGHPLIAQAAVVGQEDPVLGTAVVACVELKPGAQMTEAEVIAHTSSLPVPARPVRVHFNKALPRNGNGKIDKRSINLPEVVS